jgi:recombinational DNA repair protein RecT
MTIEEIKQTLNAPDVKSWFTKGTPYEEQKTAVLALFSESEALRNCSKMSIRLAISKLAKYGLSLANAECYLIAQRDTVRYQLSAQGKIIRMIDSGVLVAIVARDTVYEGEEYETNIGRVTKHVRNSDIRALPIDKKIAIGAYVIARVNGGVEVHAIMDKSDFEARKKLSASAQKGNSMKWDKFPEEAHYTTCVSRLYKMIGGRDPDLLQEEEDVNVETGEVTLVTPEPEQNEELEV